MKHDFKAKIFYLLTKDGGRRTPAFSGYRPHVKFEGHEYLTSGHQTFLDKEEVFPGEHIMVDIAILSPDFFAGKLHEGMKFEIGEGARVVGRGEILEIYNKDLLI